MSESNPVFFQKFQGESAPDGYDLTKDDFMIVIQSPFQKKMVQKFSSNGICVDATHGTTGYDFLLTSLVVIDEYGEGFPIAWCLSNHEHFTHMCIFYQMIKRLYNAWLGVMGGKPVRLFCTWHVEQSMADGAAN